jgi:tetratricopeptide (TPR) repeat protein
VAKREDAPSRRVQAIIETVARAQRAGQIVDKDAIAAAHPELAPQLGEALRTLSVVADAARRAGDPANALAGSDRIATAFGEDIAFLRAALPNYEIIEPLDYGGQAVVYKAVQRSTRRPVAIKLLLDGPLVTERQRQRFAREVEVISRLRHPNVVTLFESDVVRNRAYFAMEYVEGVPVDDYVLLHHLGAAEIVELFITVCHAVSHAHQHGVIHRDLGPDNILVDLAGNPRVLDFGLAKDIWDNLGSRDGRICTMPGQVFGKLPYLSPEQAGGLDMQVDVRSDIYTMGVLLFKLLTGRFPYTADENAAAVQAAIISQPPVRLRTAMREGAAGSGGKPALLRDLEVILLKALAKEKDARYQSAAAFAADLERGLVGKVVEARADNRLYLLQRVVRQHRVAVSLVLSFVITLGASAGAVTWLWTQARAERDNARELARQSVATLDDVVTEIDESVGSLAGGAAVRDRLVNGVVARRLEQLQPLVESDGAMQDVQAALREKQGDIAYAAGRHVEAAEHYRAFLEISTAREGADEEGEHVLAALVRGHRKLAEVSKNAESHLQRAVELARQLVTDDPDMTANEYVLCDTLVRLGQYYARMGSDSGAAQQLGAAVLMAESAVARDAEDPHWRALLATALEWSGDARAQLGDYTHGREQLRASLRLRESLIAETPAAINLRHAAMVSRSKLGILEAEGGEPARALELYARAAEEGEYLVSVEPEVATWKRDLHGCYNRLIPLLLRTGDIDAAAMHADRATELTRELLQAEPTNAEWKKLETYSLVRRGAVSLARGQLQDALVDFEASLALQLELVPTLPDDRVAQVQLAYTHDRLGVCYTKLGKMEEALSHHHSALEVYRELSRQQPDVAQRALNVISAQTNLAHAHIVMRTQRNDKTALALLQEALRSLVDLRDSGRISGMQSKVDRWTEAIQRNIGICTRRLEPDEQGDSGASRTNAGSE